MLLLLLETPAYNFHNFFFKLLVADHHQLGGRLRIERAQLTTGCRCCRLGRVDDLQDGWALLGSECRALG